MMPLAIFVGLATYVAIIWRQPHWGIYTTLFLLPVYQVRFTVFGIPSTLLEWLILLLALIVAIKTIAPTSIYRARLLQVFTEKKLMWPGFFVLIFLLAAGVSVAVSPETRAALGIYKAYFLEALLFDFLCLMLLDSREKILKVFVSLSLLVISMSLFGIYQFFTLYWLPPSWWGPGLEPRRVVSLYTYPNAVALLVAPITGLLAGWLAFSFPSYKKYRIFLLSALVLSVVLIALTFSRGAWLGCAAAVAAIAILSRYRKFLIGLLFVGVLVIALVPAARNRVAPVLTGTDPAGQERMKLYKGTLEILSENPVSGAGLYGFRDAYMKVRDSDSDEILNYPHNFFLNFWIETGLFGLLSIIALIVWSVFSAGKIIKTTSSPKGVLTAAVAVSFLSSMIVVLVHGMVDVPYFKNDLSLLFWFIVSLPALLLLSSPTKSA